MLELSDPRQLSQECERQRRLGHRVGFVPTMGYLHEGHLSLVQRARALADFVVLSIFVNPTQFGPSEDLARYPQDREADLAKCLAAGVDSVFLPRVEDVYPSGYQTFVEAQTLSQGLCGGSRPGHFRGVCTVVAKLCNMVGPCVALFGEKDYQQLQVVRRMATDLNLPVEVVGCPIVREPDGLAMSSRNSYLRGEHRRVATCLFRALQAVAQRMSAPTDRVSAAELITLARSVIEAEPGTRIDYVEVRDAVSLQPMEWVGAGAPPAVVALAVFVGETRLIDNLVLPPRLVTD